ncbi:HNH endonuclease [Sulfuricurvum sp.]|uniref:HNH endonuclease n=1 Tax=Sulfuricurvum sp. TaxID=2025608 RepID=UPI0035637599
MIESIEKGTGVSYQSSLPTNSDLPQCPQKLCITCNKEIIGKGILYCSAKCRYKYYRVKNKEIIRQTQRNYRLTEHGKKTRCRAQRKYANSDKGRKNYEEWVKSQNGKEKIINTRKRAYQRHRDVIIKKALDYAKTPKGRIIAKKTSLKYSKSLKGKARRARREARQRGAIHDFKNSEWELKVLKTRGICPFCSRKFTKENPLSMDHIIPISKRSEGFVYTIDDVQPLCMSCNSRKGNRVTSICTPS